MRLYSSRVYVQDLEEAVYRVKELEQLKGKTVFLTGASGLIGSYLVDMLLTANRILDLQVRIYAAGRSRERLRERFKGAETESLVYVEQDVEKPVNQGFAVDYVIHAASNAYPAAFLQDPVGTVMGNIAGTKNLLDYARERGIQDGPIFVTRGGRTLNRSNIWNAMKRLCKSAQVGPEKVYPHNLRHLFARTFYKKEKDISRLADILGHENVNTTRIYVVSSGAEHREQLESLHLTVPYQAACQNQEQHNDTLCC